VDRYWGKCETPCSEDPGAGHGPAPGPGENTCRSHHRRKYAFAQASVSISGWANFFDINSGFPTEH
jgi:hypothetical protein